MSIHVSICTCVVFNKLNCIRMCLNLILNVIIYHTIILYYEEFTEMSHSVFFLRYVVQLLKLLVKINIWVAYKNKLELGYFKF